MPAIAMISTWQYAGYNMLFFLAGLQTIPPHLYEAASIDGASAFSQFRLITLPLLNPTMLFVLVTDVTAALTAGQVAFGVLAAYAFARLRFPGRNVLFSLYLATLMVPNVVTLVPLYTMMRQVHLVNTYWALFLPYVLGSPYTIFLMRQSSQSLPSDVFAAARVAGCSEWKILTRILLPMGRPIIITATLIAFVFGWNNFLWPLIVTDSPSKQVITVGLAAFQSYFIRHFNLVLAGSLVALVPLLMIFVVFQKQIVRSIQLSGVNR